jgi:enoyl-CoA hydratase/carnithine racemase
MFCVGADLDVGFGGGASRSGESVVEVSERDLDHRDRHVIQLSLTLDAALTTNSGGRVALAIQKCCKPTIAAIQGSAVGIGITMCLPATIRVACAQAKVGFVFGRRGIIMEACSHFYLPKLIGLSRAMHVTTTGSVYPASHPLLQDLFSEILPTPQATLERAIELANDIAENVSTISSKIIRDLQIYGSSTPEEAHLLDSRLIHSLFGSRDNIEGVKSFFEKRPPHFTGSPQRDMPSAWPWWRQVDVGYVNKSSAHLVAKL